MEGAGREAGAGVRHAGAGARKAAHASRSPLVRARCSAYLQLAAADHSRQRARSAAPTRLPGSSLFTGGPRGRAKGALVAVRAPVREWIGGSGPWPPLTSTYPPLAMCKLPSQSPGQGRREQQHAAPGWAQHVCTLATPCCMRRPHPGPARTPPVPGPGWLGCLAVTRQACTPGPTLKVGNDDTEGWRRPTAEDAHA